MSFRVKLAILLQVVFVAFSAEGAERGSAYDHMHPSYIADGPATLAPLAFLQFCSRYAAQCGDQQSEETTVNLTPALFAKLSAVNAEINNKIKPDPNKGAVDWSLETHNGNCNDYAVQKRSELAASGFPLSALSLVTALTYSGEGHLVLSVRTDRGDFILDNLHKSVLPASSVNYTWLKRQSINPMKWVSIEVAST